MLTHTAYGKSQIRLVQVLRHGDRHELSDLDVSIAFEGDYDEAYTRGDNRGVLPTDTMKNTVYALAAEQPVGELEAFGQRLATHFLAGNPRLGRITVDLIAHLWRRLAVGAHEHGQAFMGRGPETRTAAIAATTDGVAISAGIHDLLIMKTGRSAFAGFPRDRFTTLPETRDRLLATSLTATWDYPSPDIDFGVAWRLVRDTMLETFAEHDSESVQHTLHAMGQAVLDAVDDVSSITLVMPNRHHLPVDLRPFGLENRNEIFVATTEPFGRIEATLTR